MIEIPIWLFSILTIITSGVIGGLTGTIINIALRKLKKMKTKGQKGKGKEYLETLKYLKKLCIKYYGIGFLFCSPKIRAALMESMNEFIDDLIGIGKYENN